MEESEIITSLIQPFLKPTAQRTESEISDILLRLPQTEIKQKLQQSSEDFLKSFSQYLTLEIFEPSDRLSNFGEVCSKMYVVLYGEFKLFKPEFSADRNTSPKEIRETIARQLAFIERREVRVKADKEVVDRIKAVEGVRSGFNRKASIQFDVDFLKNLSRVNDVKEAGRLRVGDVFGEAAVMSGVPREVTAEARAFSVCAVVTREDYMKVLACEDERKTIEKAQFLQRLPIFASTNRQAVLKYAGFFSVLRFSKNQMVYRDLMPADMVYFIESGEFQVSKSQDQSVKKIIEAPAGFLSSQKSLIKIENAREIAHSHHIQIAIRGQFEILGYDEYLSGNSLRVHSCKCISTSGTLYAIKTIDFKQKITDPEAVKFIKNRHELSLNREKSLENAGKVVANMAKSDSKPVISGISSLSRGDEYLKNLISSMHEKKAHKKLTLSTPYSPWNYHSPDLSFKEKPRLENSRLHYPKMTPKPSETPLLRIQERVKRVPPPNFMIGMRDLHKVYESDMPGRKGRNFSSIY